MNPVERENLIEEYRSGFDTLSAALTDVPRKAWEFKPAPQEWSVHELIVHMADSECMGVIRLRKLIAEPGSTLMPYAEEKWSDALNYRNQDLEEALQIFRLLRQTTSRLLEMLPGNVLTLSLVHPQWEEPYTFDKWLVIYAHHVPEHLEQLRNIYRAWIEKGK